MKPISHRAPVKSPESLPLTPDTALQDRLNEITRQASLVRARYEEFNVALLQGNEAAIAAARTRLETQKAAFQVAQKQLRANLLQSHPTTAQHPVRSN